MEEQLLALQARMDDHEAAINKEWILVSAAMILLMQAGFSVIEAGSVRAKNSSNILIKNVFDSCIGAIAWYLLGYGFAYGESNSHFIGSTKFAGSTLAEDNEYVQWVFGFTFCATSATIVSGSLAERTYLETYLLFSFIMCSFIYPVVVHWAWNENGWLY